MRPMLRELSTDQDSGMLGYQLLFGFKGAGDRASISLGIC